MKTTVPVPATLSRKSTWVKILLTCGIVSSLLYAAMNAFVPMLWEGYSMTGHTVSELSAIGVPTRPVWVALGIFYTLLVAAFGWGVLKTANRSRPLRVVGILLIIYGVIGLAWPPMHRREVLAAGGGTLTDTLHIVFTIATVLLMLLSIGFGAAAFGKGFRNIGLFLIWVVVLATMLLRAERSRQHR